MKYLFPGQAKYCGSLLLLVPYQPPQKSDIALLHGGVVWVLGEIKVWYPMWQRVHDSSLGHMGQGWKGAPHLSPEALSQAVGQLLQQRVCCLNKLVQSHLQQGKCPPSPDCLLH